MIINFGNVIDPFWGSIASGASSLLGLFGGSSASLKAQRETNAMNYKIAQEANQTNLLMQQKANEFNLDMWNRNNSYNDPSAQAKRMLAAGINPYQSGDISSGNSSSFPQTTAPSANVATMQSAAPLLSDAYQNAFQSIGDTLYDALTNRELRKQQIRSAQLENDFQQVSFADRLSKIASESRERFSKANLQQLETFFKKDNYLTELNQNKAELQSKLIRNYGQTLQNKIFSVTHKYLEPQKVAELLQMSATLNVTNASAKKIAADIIKTNLEANGIRINNRQQEQLTDYIVNIKRVESKNMSDYGFPFISNSSVARDIEGFFGLDKRYNGGRLGKLFGDAMDFLFK